ncbi:MAG: GMC family oxidoreductase, partial [Methylocystis sp.]|nr:GMC family oxidoreductase [Methylocystis sp.]
AEIINPAVHDDMSIAVARRLGGASNLWGGRCMPLDPVDFAPRSYVGDARWPMTHDEIAPFYERACHYASCGAPVFEAPLAGAAVSSDDFSFTSIERASNRPKFHKAHGAALSASRLIDLRLNATVVDFDSSESGAIAAVVVAARDGSRRRIEADRFVLAAGGLETTRLLLIAQRKRPESFGGVDGPLGRFYMGHIIGEVADITFLEETFHAGFDFFKDGHGSYVRRRFVPSAALQQKHNLPNVCFWPVVPPIADPSHESGALSAVALALSTPILGEKLVPEAIRARHLGAKIDWRPHLRNVFLDAPETLAFLARFVRERYFSSQRIPGYFLRNRARRYGLSYHAEQSPRSDSRVVLSQVTDALGAPRLQIDLRFHREDAEAVARAHQLLSEWLLASKIACVDYRCAETEIIDAITKRMSHGTHQIGTARMGFSRGSAVVDKDLCCFDAPNLYVASSAVFPTSAQANPTLSIVAFAVRLAAHLAVEAGAPIKASRPAA